MSPEPVIRVLGLSFTYAGTPGPALQDLNLEIRPGELCAVVGANGAGKSSLCFALTGFIPHFYHGVYRGEVLVEGLPVGSHSPADLAGRVGLVFQNPFNQITGARFSVREEIAFGLENLGVARDVMEQRIAHAISLTGLEGLEGRSPYSLSGGQQQRLAIASLIAMRPPVLVLDEPTSQLDPAGTREVLSALREMASTGETTVVLTEHKLAWIAAYADRVVALAHGRVLADGPAREVLGSDEVALAGVGETRFTQAARLARSRSLIPGDRSLPVTLEQAVEFFR